jgi:hypothetical protein
MVAHTLIRPIIDNKLAYDQRWPKAHYKGDIGNPDHLKGSGDHTPWSSDKIFGMPMRQGWVYAQDFGNGAFDLAAFARWLLSNLRSGHYGEVKYVISRHPANFKVAGGTFYGLFDRRYNWRTQRSYGHESHIHISYMPGYEKAPSRIMSDYWAKLHPQPKPDPKWKRWAQAPPLPSYSLGRYSTRTFNRLPQVAWPPIVLGYGGPDSGPQQDFVRCLHQYAVNVCKTIMIGKNEIDAAEIGQGTIAWCKLVTQTKAGNGWANDPGRNGRALGGSLGAPATW